MSHLRSAGGQGWDPSASCCPEMGSAERGLSLPVPLSFLSVFPKSLYVVTNLNPSVRNTLNSAIFYIANHQVQPHVLLVAALKRKKPHTHTYTEAHTHDAKILLILLALQRNGRAPEPMGTCGAPFPPGVAGKAHRSILALQ